VQDLVSVIIPCYNAEKWIEKAIQSCLEQKYLHEIIIVDDSSTDNSYRIIENFVKQNPHKIKLYLNPNKGGNNARNFGFEHSSGKYIQWLDADDYLLPGKFEAQVEFLEKNTQIEMVYSDWRLDIFDETEKVKNQYIHIKQKSNDFIAELLKDNWNVPASYLLTYKLTNQLHSIYAWNPETRVGQDREYFTLAAIYANNKVAYIPGVFSVYNRWSKQTVSQKNSIYVSVDMLKINRRIEEELKVRKQFIFLYKKSINSLNILACIRSKKVVLYRPVLFFNWKMFSTKQIILLILGYLWYLNVKSILNKNFAISYLTYISI
jgi:glycosyltransferase involved in cell wall biosynthesis